MTVFLDCAAPQHMICALDVFYLTQQSHAFVLSQIVRQQKTGAEGEKKRSKVRTRFDFYYYQTSSNLQQIYRSYILKSTATHLLSLKSICSGEQTGRGTERITSGWITPGWIHTDGNSSNEDLDEDTECYFPPLLSFQEDPQVRGRPVSPRRIICFVNKHRGQTGVLPGHSCRTRSVTMTLPSLPPTSLWWRESARRAGQTELQQHPLCSLDVFSWSLVSL